MRQWTHYSTRAHPAHHAEAEHAMAANYDIVGQQEVVGLSAAGEAVRSMQVTFRTKPSGIEGTVTIPIVKYSPGQVVAQIEPYAADIEATHAL
jgi:hypothetical protein